MKKGYGFIAGVIVALVIDRIRRKREEDEALLNAKIQRDMELLMNDVNDDMKRNTINWMDAFR